MKTLFAILTFALLLATGCTTTYTNRQIVGETFPTVQGEALDKKEKELPKDIKGKTTLLLVAYVQNTQFDVDRWLLGLEMSKTKVSAIEVPAIQGMFPRMFSGYIDEGMRKGIPKELWGGVVTVYRDGDKLQKFTGNENPSNTRVVLVDANGVIKYFSDDGFSVGNLTKLRTTIESLAK
jgi:hypothetical protein